MPRSIGYPKFISGQVTKVNMLPVALSIFSKGIVVKKLAAVNYSDATPDILRQYDLAARRCTLREKMESGGLMQAECESNKNQKVSKYREARRCGHLFKRLVVDRC